MTVARMMGMAVGLAVLTAYGSTQIDRISAQVYATPDGYRAVIPAELQGRSLQDPLVVAALEAWAARKAAETMVGLFLVAGIVTVVAIPAGLLLGDRPRMLSAESAAQRALAGAGGGDGGDGRDVEPLAL